LSNDCEQGQARADDTCERASEGRRRERAIADEERGRAYVASDGGEGEAAANGIRGREGGGDEEEARGRWGMGFRPGA
jgi:hypothetical protein